MPRVLVVAIVCVSLGHALARAQPASPYNIVGDMRNVPCDVWTEGARPFQNGLTKEVFNQHVAEHAWVYGYLAGAGLFPPRDRSDPERVGPSYRVDIRRVDEWMGLYCRRHPMASIADGAAALAEDLEARRGR